MVVWLKPCKSRSSPGALSERLSSTGGAFVFARQRDPQQVIARGFTPTPGAEAAGVFLLLLARQRALQQVIARGLTPTRAAEAAGVCLVAAGASARAATGHRQGLYQNASPAMGRRSPLRVSARCDGSSSSLVSRRVKPQPYTIGGVMVRAGRHRLCLLNRGLAATAASVDILVQHAAPAAARLKCG